MATWSEQLHETSLDQCLEKQKQLVARLVSEGKDAIAANAKLYELSKALAEIRHELTTNPSKNGGLRPSLFTQNP
jgi:hypothetical protein